MFLRTTNYALFRLQLAKNSRKENLGSYTDGEYAEAFDVYLHYQPSGSAGFAVNRYTGELVNLFSNSPTPGLGRIALLVAIQLGARSLDCFDGFLVNFYEKYGSFSVVQRVPFIDKFAPTNWDYEKNGRPDVVYMERLGSQ